MLAFWAADCAGRVLPHFEEKHPQDDRSRKAIEAARSWARGEIRVGEARTAAFAAHAAAREVEEGSARQTARATGHAAARPMAPRKLRSFAISTYASVFKREVFVARNSV